MFFITYFHGNILSTSTFRVVKPMLRIASIDLLHENGQSATTSLIVEARV